MKGAEHSRYQVKVPGKTFVVGEYLALAGGPSIIVNTAPCFEFSWESGPAGRAALQAAGDDRTPIIHHPFHQNSPAGQWLKGAVCESSSRGARTENVIQFKDPFQGRGGLGASTAEFVGAWIFRHWLAHPAEWDKAGTIVASLEDRRETIAPTWKSERVGSSRFRDLLDDYRSTGAQGSGADLVSQVTGGVAVWDATTDEMRRFRWPFQDLALSLFFTGKKVATHEHLATLTPLDEGVHTEMRSWVEDAVQALALEDADRFIASVRGFGKVLDDAGRVADHTRALLEDLADCSGVRAAKGCGAMGSDVLLVLHDRGAGGDLSAFRDAHGLKLVGTDADLWLSGLELIRPTGK